VASYDAREVEAALALLRSSGYGWVVFTSANAVDALLSLSCDAGGDARAFGRARIAAIGPGTADALGRHGLRADVVPAEYIAEGLVAAFGARVMRGQRVLLPRAAGARPELIAGLEAMGARADELVLYRAAVPAERDSPGLRRLRDGEVDIVTFASSSAVRNLVSMLEGDVAPLRRAAMAAIGPVTAQAVRDAGLQPDVVARVHTVEGLVAALVDSETRAREVMA
jgi:uroporphyrinogen III methyltransferase/synthase